MRQTAKNQQDGEFKPNQIISHIKRKWFKHPQLKGRGYQTGQGGVRTTQLCCAYKKYTLNIRQDRLKENGKNIYTMLTVVLEWLY